MNNDTIEQLFVINPDTDHHLSLENKIYKYESDTITIINDHDLCYPLFVTSDTPLKKFILKIDNKIIINFPLNFCDKLLNNNITNGINADLSKYIYKIPWKLLKFESLPILRLKLSKIEFKVECDDKIDYTGVNLYMCNIYLKPDDKQKLENLEKKIDEIKVFQEKNLIINQENNKIKLGFEGVIKGLFLDNIDMSQIESFNLLFGEYDRIAYDSDMLLIFTDKIASDCYYISFDNLPYNDKIWDSSINLTGIEHGGNTIYIKIKSSIEQNIIIRALSHDVITTNDEMNL
jgi:hypothetical protein